MKNLIVPVFALALYLMGLALAQSVYLHICPGVPDAGQVPTSMLPELMFVYLRIPTYGDGQFLYVLLFALLAYAVPFFLLYAALGARGQWPYGILVSAIILGHAFGGVWQWRGLYFFERPATFIETAGVLFHHGIWIFGTTLASAVAGMAIRKKLARQKD